MTSIIHRAIENSESPGALSRAIGQAKGDLRQPDAHGDWPIHLACRLQDSAAAIRELLNHYTPDEVSTAKNRDGDTPLAVCARNGRYSNLSVLLEFAKVEVNTGPNKSSPALIRAARGGFLKILVRLLRVGANPLSGASYGNDPAAVARRHRNYDCLRHLEYANHPHGEPPEDPFAPKPAAQTIPASDTEARVDEAAAAAAKPGEEQIIPADQLTPRQRKLRSTLIKKWNAEGLTVDQIKARLLKNQKQAVLTRQRRASERGKR